MTGEFLLCVALLGAGPAGSEQIRVRILTHQHPRRVGVSGPAGQRELSAAAGRLRMNGEPAETVVLPAGAYTLVTGAAPPFQYEGALELGADGDEVSIVLTLPLERYVVEVVTAETAPGTPNEALRAQAIVARSYVLASRGRHGSADACDLAHCQVLRGRGIPASHRAAAGRATESTRGRILVLGSGAVAGALFHARCGGHTLDPREVFGGDGSGAAAVPDDGCGPAAWSTVVPENTARQVLASTLGSPSPSLDGLRLDRGIDEGVVRVVDPESGRSAPGEVVARQLDAALGWGRVRSPRFRFEPTSSGLRVSGRGIGHGVGLCQAGAVRRAGRGETAERILAWFFPGARIVTRVGPEETQTRTDSAAPAVTAGQR